MSTADATVMVAAANIASRVLTELLEESGSYVCVLRPLRKLRYRSACVMVGSLVIMGGGATISGFVGLAFYEGGVGVLTLIGYVPYLSGAL